MVDTINPNTGQSDSLPINGQNQPMAGDPNDRFYGGFDQPDNVKINLAEQSQLPGEPTVAETANLAGIGAATQAPVYEAPISNNAPVTPEPVMDQISQPDLTDTETTKHETYTTKPHVAPINTRGLLVIIGIGLAAMLILDLGTYFVISSMQKAKLESVNSSLNSAKSELASLNKTPEALALPVQESPTSTTTESTPTNTENTTPTTPTTAPSTTPTIETPAPSVPSTTEDGSRGGTG